jgi:tetratricopeptide (TPR) repeat protein
VASRSDVALIGRDPALALLAAALDRAMTGRTELVLLAGEAGIGKTALLREMAARASARAHVLWGTAWDRDGAPPFWPWAQVLRGYLDGVGDGDASGTLGSSTEELSRLLPELAADRPRRAPLDPERARFELFDAVAGVLGRAALGRPLVVVLDDLHWADEPSLRLLAFLVRRLPTARLLLVGAYRDVEAGEHPVVGALVRELASSGTVVPLPRLTVREVTGLVEATTGTRPDDALAVSVHERSGGNPFFVRQLATLLAAQGESGAVPHAVRDVVERRMARLPHPSAELLTVAAVIGQRFGIDLLAEVTGRPGPDCMELLDPAVRAQVVRAEPRGPVGPYTFTHDLFRETLYDGLSATTRASLHLAVADAMQRDGSDRSLHPAEVAWHLLRAQPFADVDRVVAASARAADHASLQLAYEDAVAHYERALGTLDVGPGGQDARRSRLVLDLAEARRRAGRLDAAQGAYHEAARLAGNLGLAEHLAEAALGLHDLGVVTGHDDTTGAARLHDALAALGHEDHPLRARLLASIARHAFHAKPESVAHSTAAEESVAVARRLGDPATLAFCLLALHDVRWRAGTAEERLAITAEMSRAAEEAGDYERHFEAAMLRLTALLELGDPGAGMEMERLVRLGARLCQPRAEYYVLSRRAAWSILTGDLAEGSRLAEQALELGRSLGVPDAPLVHACHVAALQRASGRPRGLLAETGPLPVQDYPHFQAVVDGLDAFYGGEFARAEAILTPYAGEELTVLSDRSGHSDALQLALVAEGFVGLGLVEGCRRVYGLLLPHQGRCIVAGGAVVFWGAVSHHLGILARATGDRASAVAHFEEALTVHERLGARPWVAATKLALAAELLDGTDADRGRRLLAEAKILAGAIGMEVPHDPPAAKSRPAVDREGSIWRLAYAGRAVRLPHSKGLGDLARLLAAPGVDLHVSELAGVDEGGADVVLDEAAKAAYRRRLGELEQEVAEADAACDLGQAARARAERDVVVEELARALGLGGRNRKLGDPSERARKAVTARVRDALRRIEAEHPALGAHLRASVRTGAFCSYRPPDPA